MLKRTLFLSVWCVLFSLPLFSQTYSDKMVIISTSYGDMKIRLFNETPLHRDNFLKLAESGFYDSLLFHRIINEFMIQGGDPTSKHAPDGQMLGEGENGYTIPAEFNPKLYHKKGMLCAARQGDDVNPAKASSGCQFYIVMGKKLNAADLKSFEYRINRPLLTQLSNEIMQKPEAVKLRDASMRAQNQGKSDSVRFYSKQLDDMVLTEYNKQPHFTFTPEQIHTYETVGGTPHLDGSYTVFGEVVEGLDVIDKIAAVAKDHNDRPLENVRMTMKVVTVKN